MDVAKKELGRDAFLHKTALQLKIHFYFNPQNLESVLKAPEVVERLKADK